MVGRGFVIFPAWKWLLLAPSSSLINTSLYGTNRYGTWNFTSKVSKVIMFQLPQTSLLLSFFVTLHPCFFHPSQLALAVSCSHPCFWSCYFLIRIRSISIKSPSRNNFVQIPTCAFIPTHYLTLLLSYLDTSRVLWWIACLLCKMWPHTSSRRQGRVGRCWTKSWASEAVKSSAMTIQDSSGAKEYGLSKRILAFLGAICSHQLLKSDLSDFSTRTKLM